jgi:ABC-2 type transport system ATP-binding protein
LDGLSLSAGEKQIFGLLGRNGAGKTTMIKILLGLVRPTEGEARVLGFPAGSIEARRRTGYLPEGHDLPDYHTGASALDFYAHLSGMPRRERRSKIP